MAEVPGHPRGKMGSWSLDVEVDDPNPLELLGTCDEGVEQHRRCGRRAVDVNLITRLDAGNGLGWADDPHDRSLGRGVGAIA